MMIACECGVENSAFTPRCPQCGRTVEEPAPPISVRSRARSLTEGDEAGEYRIGSLLGAGGIGRVHRGVHRATGRAVAIKVLHEHMAQSRELRARFAREARALSRVRHRYIGGILDVLDVEETTALVLEAHEGMTLRAILERDGTIAAARLLPWLRQLAEALGALHAAGWIHRDVKPENVFLAMSDQGAEVRLLDFGLVREMEGAGDSVETAAGAFVGSLAYAAPEQILGEETGPFTDWWAVGVVAYEALLGRLPFVATTRAMTAAAVLTKEPSLDGMGSGLAEWVGALLAKDGAKRPASADAVIGRLDSLHSSR